MAVLHEFCIHVYIYINLRTGGPVLSIFPDRKNTADPSPSTVFGEDLVFTSAGHWANYRHYDANTRFHATSAKK